MNKPKFSKFSPAMSKLLRKIDINTRSIAKLESARAWLRDWEIRDGVCELENARFAVIQERRNLKLKFEEEYRRLQTSA